MQFKTCGHMYVAESVTLKQIREEENVQKGKSFIKKQQINDITHMHTYYI